jgi:outer membrane PBP1 activator LpoA protein
LYYYKKTLVINMTLPRIYLATIVLLSMALSACQSLSPLAVPNIEAESQAQIAVHSGNFSSAAQQYEELAESSSGTHQTRLYVQAASAYWQLGQVDQARVTLAKIDREQLTSTLSFDIALLKANIATQELDSTEALALLASYRAVELTAKQQRLLYRARIQAYQVSENWLETANSHIQLDNLLPDRKRKVNQQKLWQALMMLTSQALDLFNPGYPPSVDSGWFALAYIIKTYQNNPDIMIIAMDDWQRSYPNHPASPSIYQQEIEKTGTLLPQRIGRIAILLPTSGPYADVASAIREGISAAHYADNSGTELHFIKTQTDAITGLSNVQSAYQQAVDLNAGLVIGPLDKQSIQILAESRQLPVPVLALNRLSGFRKKTNLYQFGLAPEDDAISAAKNAIAKGYRRALIVVPEAAWGQRMAAAFEAQWSAQGGMLLGQATYDEALHDYANVIAPLFGLSASEQRYKKVKQTLGFPAEFEPRRRQDIDLIFLAARPNKARELVPQFRYHRSGQLPIVATSHAYSGQEDTQQDIDLNGLFINDIPWVFSELTNVDYTYQALAQQESTSFGRLLRLYALGADAYRLSQELNRLSHSPTLSFQGATGALSIDDNGYVNRQLNWGTFSGGKIKLLASPEDEQ